MIDATDIVVIDALRRDTLLTLGHALSPDHTDDRLAIAASAELVSCGYLVTPETLSGMAPGTITETVRAAAGITGSDRLWAPLFPDFPDTDGASADEATARAAKLSGAVSVYVNSGVVPEDFTPRISLAEVLRRGRQVTTRPRRDYLEDRLGEILASPADVSVADAEVMTAIVAELAPVDPDGLIRRVTTVAHGHVLARYARALTLARVDAFPALVAASGTADDLLRAFLATHATPSAPAHDDAHTRAVVTLSNAAAYSVRIIATPRSHRRLITARLGDLTDGHRADTLVTRRDLWRRVIQACHPYELHPNAATRRALDIITDDVTHRTLDSLVEEYLAADERVNAADLLATHRPGQLLRRLVQLATDADTDTVTHLATAVTTNCHRVPLSTSLSAYDGLLSAATARPRLIRALGGGTYLSEEIAPALPKETVTALTGALRSGITARLARHAAPTGPVPTGSAQPLNLIRRDASTSRAGLVRGREYAPSGSGDTLRLLCHWYDTDTGYGVDLDLGAVITDENFDPVITVTWNSYDNSGPCRYSGDQTSAPRPAGASEFIDVNLVDLRENHPKARYVVCSVYNYSGQPLNQVDHLVGAALIDSEVEGDTALFEPTSVDTAARATTAGTALIPLVFDLASGRFRWLDTDPGYTTMGESVAGDGRIAQVLLAEVGRERLSEGELASWYAAAHGAETDAGTEPDSTLIDQLIGA